MQGTLSLGPPTYPHLAISFPSSCVELAQRKDIE
jgi:hypothetical protein